MYQIVHFVMLSGMYDLGKVRLIKHKTSFENHLEIKTVADTIER